MDGARTGNETAGSTRREPPSKGEKVADWADGRLGLYGLAKANMRKVFPDHWSFMLGEVCLYSFLILILTGIYLTLFFEPSGVEVIYHGSYVPLNGVPMTRAYESTLDISFDVRGGLLIRQIHHWAALVFVTGMLVHMMRVFFTGAFRRPRELNWIVGVTLFILAFFNGFTGYSLPDDLLSGTGLRIAYSIALSVPVLGSWLAFLVFGGEFPAHEIIPRLFVTHVMIVPGLILGLLTVHLAIIWRQKHTDFPGPGRTETNVVGSKLWPTYTMNSLGLFFAVFAVLIAMGGLLQINPVWLYGPFRPDQVPSPAQPDWWLGWLEGALRIFPPWEVRAFDYEIPNPFFPGVLLPGITFGLLYLWPFLEAKITKDRTPHNLLDRARDRPARTAMGATTLAFYVMLQLAASNDLIANKLSISVASITRFFQAVVILVPPLVGYVTYRLMKGLQVSQAERFATVPLEAVLHPKRYPVEDGHGDEAEHERVEREERTVT
ncbi:MAG TPA: cytochrome bc complex cytochrome b subunit [Actinomycetota bacterium]|nr:cytochrome bc complex cytochrome b subunit [Actinomycetota bacterium]